MLTTEQNINVNRLIEELRSGDFKQADSALKIKYSNENQPRYCCLGVAAEAVLGKEFVAEVRIKSADKIYYEYYVEDYGRFNSKLADDDKAELGFNISVASYEVDKLKELTGKRFIGIADRQDALMAMNDQDVSFENIATVIVAMGWDVN